MEKGEIIQCVSTSYGAIVSLNNIEELLKCPVCHDLMYSPSFFFFFFFFEFDIIGFYYKKQYELDPGFEHPLKNLIIDFFLFDV